MDNEDYFNKLVDKAYDLFCRNLEKIRKIVPVKTICMHGSPMSKWDSRLIWQKYDYKKLGIIGEPYFDIDFSKVLYLTDTGRRWDGEKVSVRDKVIMNNGQWPMNNKAIHDQPSTILRHTFHSTFDIISAAEKGQLSDKIMITVHPQRWTNKPLPWLKELVWQNMKNIVKRIIVTKQ